MIRFETDRLIIRDMEDPDLDSLLAIYRHEETMKYISSGRFDWTGDELRTKLTDANKNYSSGFGIFAVEIRDTNQFIGEAGLFNSFHDLAKLELGYILNQSFHNQGFGTEVCNGLIKYGFQELGVKTLVARMYAKNTASVRLSEKCGMKLAESGQTLSGAKFLVYKIEHQGFTK